MDENSNVREDLQLSKIDHWQEVNKQVLEGYEQDKALILTVLKVRSLLSGFDQNIDN